MDRTLGNIVANVIATGAGAAVGGGDAGAFAGYNVDKFNRQLHPEEKTKAQQIAATAKAQGLTNADGSSITAAQIENAMRGANNSQYGETAAQGVVVLLNANTPANAVYDTTGMKLVQDSTGNYLMQDPSVLATPSKTLQTLITQNTGGESSPYSWGTSTSQVAAPSIDPYGPFLPAVNGCVTAECAAGLSNSDYRNNPNVTVQAGFHIPISAGVAIGPNFSYTANDGSVSIKPDIALGSLGDIGVNAGIYGDSRYSGPSVINFGLGKYLGVQITPSNVTAWNEKSWSDATRYVNGLSAGIGAGFATPVSTTIDPTYQSPGQKK
jgi:filamentous hemagglutinin